jgi:hypothetical protein
MRAGDRACSSNVSRKNDSSVASYVALAGRARKGRNFQDADCARWLPQSSGFALLAAKMAQALNSWLTKSWHFVTS